MSRIAIMRYGHTRKEARLCHAKQHTSHHQAGEVLHEASKGHDDTPANDKNSEVCRGPLEPLQDDIRGHFQQNVRDEEDRDAVRLPLAHHRFDLSHRALHVRDVVLDILHAKVIQHSFNFGISDVRTVDMSCAITTYERLTS